MKFFRLFIFTSALATAADFSTGQAARMIIGQPTFTAQNTGVPSAQQLGAVGGIAYANDTLLVVDGNRVQAVPIQNRVLVYRNLSSFVTKPTDPIAQGGRCPVCSGSTKPDGGQQYQASSVVGQPDFFTVTTAQTQSGFRTPTGVATDGQIMAVTDTDNNRVLIWKSIPANNGVPADIVLGQPDFTTVKQPPVVDNKSFRGPQGVWIQGTKFFVADTQNHRVMVWNNIPTSNNQPADFVLGQPNFTTAPQPNLAVGTSTAAANNLLNPVSVTSDGKKLFVTDLGHHRVLIWNSIPTQTQQAADVEVGQPDLVSATENNSTVMCASNGSDPTTNKPTYPARCGSTLSFPRYALSDGTRLYVADGGNDRILVFKSIPQQNGATADAVLGQVDEFSDVITDSTDTFRPDANITRSSSDTIRTPTSLAWDGSNLLASDPYDRRVLVYSPGLALVSLNGISNAFSKTVFAVGTVDLTGTIKADDTVSITIAGTPYTYKVLAADTLATVVTGLVKAINAAPDPNVFAIANTGFNEVVLSAKKGGSDGNAVTLAVATSAGAVITATASGTSLSRGSSAAEVAPGSLVTIFGSNLSDTTVVGKPNDNGYYPFELGGVTVYFDGIKGPILSVSPNQINTQVPFGVSDTNAISSYVVTRHFDNTVTSTTALNVPIVFSNPGILAADAPNDPRPVMAFHTSSYGVAVVDVGGTVKANDTGTITVDNTSYTYTVQSSDTITTIRDALIGLINADSNVRVTASAAGQYTRIILTAKTPGADGNGITVATGGSSGAALSLTALQPATCCANQAGALVTQDNPATPGEIISIYATGIGVVLPDDASAAAQTGLVYNGPSFNSPNTPVDDAQVGGSTANVLNAGLKPGFLGVYEVQLQLSSSLTDNPATQLFIAQNVFTSNIVTIPVKTVPAQ